MSIHPGARRLLRSRGTRCTLSLNSPVILICRVSVKNVRSLHSRHTVSCFVNGEQEYTVCKSELHHVHALCIIHFTAYIISLTRVRWYSQNFSTIAFVETSCRRLSRVASREVVCFAAVNVNALYIRSGKLHCT